MGKSASKNFNFAKRIFRTGYEFFKFSIFSASFLDRFLNYDASSPKCFKKKILDTKFSALTNDVGRTGLNIKKKSENRKNPSFLKNS